MIDFHMGTKTKSYVEVSKDLAIPIWKIDGVKQEKPLS